MSKQAEISRRSSRRQEMGGRLIPRSFSKQAWHRFDQDRRRRYLERLGGLPSDAQAARIDTLVRLEWSALRAEAAGTLQGDREAREHRRLLDRLLGDLERSLAKPMVEPKPLNYKEHVARRDGASA